MAGILNIVPYVGLILTLAASCMVALFDPAPASALLRVLAVFAVVQALEGNLITPKIVGERVGLHPLWVMLAVMVFSRIWGIAGMVAAVPVAAVINVLFRASGEAYFRSGFYRGDPS
jgi:predicted PurR-regulated permease PerM